MNMQSIFFLGIGGIGMSALARFLKIQPIKIAGYDKTCTALTQELEKENIPVYYEDIPELIADFDCVVYTPAIPKTLKLFQTALHSKKLLLKRSQLLGEISKNYDTLAVAGTHGKTTTSGMLTHLLKSSGLDCSAFVGGITKNYHSNFILGKSNTLVVEADEYDRSFLTLFPQNAIITSVDPDHLDIYQTSEGFIEGFYQFASQVQDKIFLDENLKEFAKNIKKSFHFYGITKNTPYNIVLKESYGLKNYFDYHSPFGEIKDLVLHFPGEHNLKNICAAISLAMLKGASIDGIKKGVSTFQGIQRRFDIILDTKEMVYIDDYAHHPVEISTLLNSVKKLLPNYPIIAIFQPHLYSRTKDFANQFAESLSIANTVIMLPIYPARENPIPGITSQMIYEQIQCKHKYLISMEEIVDKLPQFITKPSVILTIGAGDIDKIVEPLKNKLISIQ